MGQYESQYLSQTPGMVVSFAANIYDKGVPVGVQFLYCIEVLWEDL